MHRILITATTIAVLGGVALVSSVALRSEQRPSKKSVQLNVTCGAGNVRVTVNPWERDLIQGDTVEWSMASSADSDDFSIEPKQASRWAYSDAPPYRGTKANAAQARAMKPSQAGQRYAYNITMTCQQGPSGPYTVIVDPDIVIR